MRATTASTGFSDPTSGVEVSIRSETPALIDEARRLTGEQDDETIVRRALAEYVERQRFLRWVALHEHAEQKS